MPKLSHLLETRSIEALIAVSEEPGKRLNKTLGPWSLMAFGIGAVIGSGIFILTGTAAAGDNIVWGTLTRREPRLNLLTNPLYGWFLDLNNRAPWMRQEFGEAVAVRTSGQ